MECSLVQCDEDANEENKSLKSGLRIDRDTRMSVVSSVAKSYVEGFCFLEIRTPTPVRNVRSSAPREVL